MGPARRPAARKIVGMCRNIRTLHNFEPPASSEEIHAAALQYVRKISGFTKPSQANQEAFDRAVDGGRPHLGSPALGPADQRAAQGPRDRGGQGAGALGCALRGLSRSAAQNNSRQLNCGS